MTASLFLTYLIYYGHENYCLGNDKPKMVKRSEVFNWVQSVDTPEDLKQTEEILQAYTDSQEFKKIQEFGKVAEGAKKKAVGKLAGVKSGALHSESSDLDQASIIDSQNGTTTSL